jgi:hypothetical protein
LTAPVDALLLEEEDDDEVDDNETNGMGALHDCSVSSHW